jgi:hypothetical protein
LDRLPKKIRIEKYDDLEEIFTVLDEIETDNNNSEQAETEALKSD